MAWWLRWARAVDTPLVSPRRTPWILTILLCLPIPMLERYAWADDPPHATTSGGVEGVILTIEPNEVVVDLGLLRGASEGDLVEIWRPLKLRHPVTGKLVEDRFKIGTLKLTQVRPAMSLAHLDGTSSRPIEKGDIVVLPRASGASSLPASTMPVSPKAANSATSSTSPRVTSTTGTTSTPPSPPISPSPSSQPPGSPSTAVSPPPTRAASASSSTVTTGTSAPVGADLLDPDAAELIVMFDQLRGADLTTRIERYEAIVRNKPRSRYAAVLYEEAHSLRALLESVSSEDPSRAGGKRSSLGKVSMDMPYEVSPALPVELTLEVEGAQGMVLQARLLGGNGFTSVTMERAGGDHWRGVIPASIVHAPGLEYFIEATDLDGHTAHIVASIKAPARLAVRDESPRAAAPPILVTASILTDVALYNTKKINDYAWQTEGFFSARFSDVGFRALRSGFGVYRGEGGTLHDLDELHLASRSVGLTYGYLESEYAFEKTLSVALRAVIGLRDAGLSGGAQGFLRIGNDRATNLVLGGEFLGGIGVRGITQLEWNTIPNVPIVLRTEVTNQPAGVEGTSTSGASGTGNATGTDSVSKGKGEIGARVIAQVGYRITPALTVALRGSYQGRTINHAGPGGGAGVTYEW